MEIITISSKEELNELYNGSAYTITGAGGSLNQWIEGYNEILKKEDIGEVNKFYTFKGSLMNKSYGLSGDNAYDPNLTFLAFQLNGLNINKLSIFKIKMGDRWFDDIVDNNRHYCIDE